MLEDKKIAKPSKNKIISKICSPEVCTAVPETPYSFALFGIPNYILGLGFYSFVLVSAFITLNNTMILAMGLISIASLIFSIYLAYVLIFKIRIMCKLCFLSHIINLLITGLFIKMLL